MLKRLINKEEHSALPAELKEHYVETDSGFLLDSDDDSYKTKLNEFRTNNVNLRREIETAQQNLARFKDVDPEKYQQAVEKLQQLEDQKLIDANKLDELLAQRTERLRSDLQGKLDAVTRDRDAARTALENAQSALSETKLSSALSKAVSAVGAVRKGAMDDVLGRAQRIWKLNEDSELVPMSGKDVMYGKDGKQQLTMEEWVTGLVDEAPHLFEGSGGGGAGGSDGGHGGTRTVDRRDRNAFASNLEDIAGGKVKAI